MIDVTVAVKNALNFIKTLQPSVFDERLEEVELTEDESNWLITLSYKDSMIATERTYKTFKLDADSGRVQYMKIRSV